MPFLEPISGVCWSAGNNKQHDQRSIMRFSPVVPGERVALFHYYEDTTWPYRFGIPFCRFPLVLFGLFFVVPEKDQSAVSVATAMLTTVINE